MDPRLREDEENCFSIYVIPPVYAYSFDGQAALLVRHNQRVHHSLGEVGRRRRERESNQIKSS